MPEKLPSVYQLEVPRLIVPTVRSSVSAGEPYFIKVRRSSMLMSLVYIQLSESNLKKCMLLVPPAFLNPNITVNIYQRPLGSNQQVL